MKVENISFLQSRDSQHTLERQLAGIKTIDGGKTS